MEFNNDGDTCAECGVFDYLPSTCPRCQHVFCREHIHHHHANLPPLSLLLTGDREALVTGLALCTASSDKVPTSSPTEGTTHTAPPTVPCHSCGSTWCVLDPCAHCGHRFCPAHRFHPHPGDATGTPSATKGPTPLSQTPKEGSLSHRCSPYTSANPLRLAPSDYHSRMTDATFLVVSTAAPDGGIDLGVCSVTAAGESSMGQVVERLAESLHRSNEVVPQYALYTLHATKDASSSRVPHLSLSPLPDKSAVTREVLLPSSTLLCVPSSTPPETVVPYLQELLFGTSTDLLDQRKDPRIRSLTTRLYLSTQKRLKSEKDSPVQSTATPPPPLPPPEETPVGSVVVPPLTSTSEETTWPFLTPPPLLHHPFLNHKGNPSGSQKAGAPRVVVAVFVEDGNERKPILPFCVALSKGWTIGKVKDCLKAEIKESPSAKEGGHHALFLLSTPALEPMAWLVDQEKVSDRLKDGSVLFFSSSNRKNASLQSEVDQLKQKKGKEGTEVKLIMMKKCTVM